MRARLEWLGIAALALLTAFFAALASRERHALRTMGAAGESKRQDFTSAPRTVSTQSSSVHAKNAGTDAFAQIRRELDALAAREKWIAFLEWEKEAMDLLVKEKGGVGWTELNMGDIQKRASQPASQRNAFLLKHADRVLQGLDEYEFQHPLDAAEQESLEAFRAGWVRWREVLSSDHVPAAEFVEALCAVRTANERFGALIRRERQELGALGSANSLLNYMMPFSSRDSSSVTRFGIPNGAGGHVTYEVDLDDRTDQ